MGEIDKKEEKRRGDRSSDWFNLGRATVRSADWLIFSAPAESSANFGYGQLHVLVYVHKPRSIFRRQGLSQIMQSLIARSAGFEFYFFAFYPFAAASVVFFGEWRPVLKWQNSVDDGEWINQNHMYVYVLNHFLIRTIWHDDEKNIDGLTDCLSVRCEFGLSKERLFLILSTFWHILTKGPVKVQILVLTTADMATYLQSIYWLCQLSRKSDV